MHFETLESRRLLSAGSLDPFFGDGGRVLLGSGKNPERIDQILPMSDGRTLAVGQLNPDGQFPSLPSLVLARFNADGSLDASFNGNGALQDGQLASFTTVRAALTPDGKIVVIAHRPEFTDLLRYNADGSLDATFGTNGVVTADIEAQNLAVTRAGKIILCGSYFRGNQDNFTLAVEVLNPDGTPDTTFAGAGFIVPQRLRTEDTFTDSFADVILALPDGDILVAGHRNHADDLENGTAFQGEILLARFNPDGSFDSAFGDRGIYFDPTTAGMKLVYDAALSPAGDRIVVTKTASGNPFLCAFASDAGTLEKTAALQGNEPFFQHGVPLAIDEVGRSYVVGQKRIDSVENFAAVRYDENLALDPTFGEGGTAVLPSPQDDVPYAIAPAADGTILIGGQGHNRLELARIFASAAPVAVAHARRITQPGSTGCRFTVTYRDDGQIDRSTIDSDDVRVVLPDGSTRKVRLIDIAATSDSGIRVAMYRFPAPGGTFDRSDNGVYSIRLRGHEVADMKGHFAVPRTIGTFSVRIAATSSTRSATPARPDVLDQDRAPRPRRMLDELT